MKTVGSKTRSLEVRIHAEIKAVRAELKTLKPMLKQLKTDLRSMHIIIK